MADDYDEYILTKNRLSDIASFEVSVLRGTGDLYHICFFLLAPLFINLVISLFVYLFIYLF